jgi:hypothetical protein
LDKFTLVALVMLVWIIDKFLNPQHAAAIFEKFYLLSGLGSTIIYAIGAV